MSFAFEKVKPKLLGYDTEQVDAFLQLAKRQFESPELTVLASERVRQTEFDLVKGGYVIALVDAALDKLEDTFANRELQNQISSRGLEAVIDRKARIIEIVSARLARPKGKRFSRATWPLRGYNRKQVDSICNLIDQHVKNGDQLDIEQVRRILFKAKRGGYAENEVDAFLDRVVEILHIERNS